MDSERVAEIIAGGLSAVAALLLIGCGDVKVKYDPLVVSDSNVSAIRVTEFVIENENDFQNRFKSESAICVELNGTRIAFELNFADPFHIRSECLR